MKKVFFSCLIFIFLTPLRALATGPMPLAGFHWDAASLYATQDRGRLKPLDTFARESVQFITGKTQWKGLQPVEIVFGWLITYERDWAKEPFIKISYGPVKTQFGLPNDRQYFSPEELGSNEILRSHIRELIQKERKREPLNDLEKKTLQVQSQRMLLEWIVSGQALAILPNPAGINAPWLSLASLTAPSEEGSAADIFPPNQIEGLRKNVGALVQAYSAGNAEQWNRSSTNLSAFLSHELGKAGYPSAGTLRLEKAYNHLRPFRLAWVGYVLAFVFLVGFSVTGRRLLEKVGLGLFTASLLGQTSGIAMRVLISGRPPVTNMYESVIWVSWGCILFSLIIGWAYKKTWICTAASVFAIVALVLADNLPSVLDPSIQPLEPVLRSNFWLTIHVLTITLSYAAFALSLCLGNVVLGNYVVRPKKTDVIQYSSLYMYRSMQIGVILLAAGTILGGVWADYSWGRFWGWDPKEVWALIALLLYLAVLHGRFTGWLQGFGFAAWTVMAFLGVLMAWYGVNFVLGAGLHSYGFGSGGTGYVGAYILLQIAFIGVAYYRYGKSGARSKKAAIFPRG